MVPEAGRAGEAQRAASLKKVPLKIRHLVLMTDTVPRPRGAQAVERRKGSWHRVIRMNYSKTYYDEKSFVNDRFNTLISIQGNQILKLKE